MSSTYTSSEAAIIEFRRLLINLRSDIECFEREVGRKEDNRVGLTAGIELDRKRLAGMIDLEQLLTAKIKELE